MVFMDVQMPEMGGFEATAEIRARERQTGRYLPVVAMTAHAMKGDRERCLEAGMDDYVSKPIQADELIRVMDRVLVANLPASESRPQIADELAFDPEAALAQMEGDEAFLAEIIEVFLKDLPDQVAALRESLANEDADTLRRTAQALKGAASNLCAPRTCAAAQQLEAIGHSGILTGAPQAVRALQQELDRLFAALIAHPLPSPMLESPLTYPFTESGVS
jgi:two-component system sensor histidine kinase/response regulator